MDKLLQVEGVLAVSQTVQTVWEKAEVFIQNPRNRRLKLASWAGSKNSPLDVERRRYGGRL